VASTVASPAPGLAGGAVRDVSTATVLGPRVVQTESAETHPAPPVDAMSSLADTDESFGAGTNPSVDHPVQRAASPAAALTVALRDGVRGGSLLVSRADDGGDSPAAGATPGGGGAGAPGAGAAPTSDKDLDELARRIFPRVALRLRGELLIDR